MTEAYPLAWPPGWPRTAPEKVRDGRDQFKRPSERGWREPWTFVAARDALIAEIGRFGATSVVLSTNFRVNRDGNPTDDRGRPRDQGIALYFARKGKPLVMACDRYVRAEENMRSLTLALDALRQLERHGGGYMMERAFEGFAAIPAPGKRPWRAVLGVKADEGLAQAEAKYRELVKRHHPDVGGDAGMFNEATAAIRQARDELKA